MRLAFSTRLSVIDRLCSCAPYETFFRLGTCCNDASVSPLGLVWSLLPDAPFSTTGPCAAFGDEAPAAEPSAPTFVAALCTDATPIWPVQVNIRTHRIACT